MISTNIITTTLESYPMKELLIDIIDISYIVNAFKIYIKDKAILKVSDEFLVKYFNKFIKTNKEINDFEAKTYLFYNNIIESVYAKNDIVIREVDFPTL